MFSDFANDIYLLIEKMNSLLIRRGYNFSIRKMVMDMLYMPDTSSRGYQIVNASIHTKPEGVEEIVCTPQDARWTVTKLPSGITVLSESVSIPTNVQLGIMIDMGTRD